LYLKVKAIHVQASTGP